MLLSKFFSSNTIRKVLLCFTIFGSLQLAFSQTFTEYRGIVKGSDSGKKLIFADINVLGTNISTITNNEGEFLIKIDNSLKNSKLLISHLGYKDQELEISNLKSDKTNTIKLTPEITQLSVVSINAVKNAKALVKAMLSRKGNNYSTNQNVMTAFYRETIKKRRKNASLSEAVVEIYKQPYNTLKNDRVNLIKARKSVDYTRLDTLAVKLQGGPFSTLYTDLMKYQEFIFTEADLSYYNFTYDTNTNLNGREVYVVNFKQDDKIIEPLYYGKLYIDAESFALVSAAYNLNVEQRDLASEMFIRKKPNKVKVYPTNASYRVDYRITNGKWYYNYSNIALTFKVNWKNKLFNSTYTLNSEMAITDWKTDNTLKKPKNPLRPTVILSEEASGFSDPNFWGKYNIIEPEKSIESAIKKINKKLKQKS